MFLWLVWSLNIIKSWKHKIFHELQRVTLKIRGNNDTLKTTPTMSMGPQKSPVRCVWGNRNGLTRRTVTPFAFADSYGPKDVRESLYWYPKSSQKNFARLQSQTTHPPRTHFTSLYLQNGYQPPKMCHQMRFEAQQSIEMSDGHPVCFRG